MVQHTSISLTATISRRGSRYVASRACSFTRSLNTIIACISAVLSCGVLPKSSFAAEFPSRPIRFISPFAPGGGNDLISRLLAQAITPFLGQQVIVDNRPGANTVVGMEIVARAVPDGYTLILTSTTQPINAALQPKLPYDSIRDFTPISMIASSPLLVVVHPSLPVKSVADLISFAKSKPGQVFFPSSGTGNISHLAGELFNAMAHVRMVHVPYKGAGPRNTDLLAGRVQVVFSSVPGVLSYVESGKLRAIAVTTKERIKILPNLPTVAESGLPGYEASTWYGVLATGATPRPIINRIYGAIAKAIVLPDVTSKLAEQGLDPIGNSPEQFNAYLKGEFSKWAKVIKAANIKPDAE